MLTRDNRVSSIHDLAALAAEISVSRPEENSRGDDVDGKSPDEEEDDIAGFDSYLLHVCTLYVHCMYNVCNKVVAPFQILYVKSYM